MSRAREEKRKKQDELARQLGVKRADVDEHKALAERERVTRPVIELVGRTRGGVLGRLLGRGHAPLACALYLVEAKGARLVDAHVLEGRRELGKLVYHRPAHFVVVVVPALDAAAVLAALGQPADVRVDGHALASAELASWEAPRQARVGLGAGGAAHQGAGQGALAGAVVSIRGVARSAVEHAMPLAEGGSATLRVEV